MTDTDTLREAQKMAVAKAEEEGASRDEIVTHWLAFDYLNQALATLSKPEPAAVGEHWSRQSIVGRILRAMVEANGKVKAVPAGKAADDILELLRPALYASPVPSGGADRFAIVEKAIAARLKHAVDHEKGCPVNAAQLASAVCTALGAYPSPSSEAISPPDAGKACENPHKDTDPRQQILREIFAETAILLTHSDPSRTALAKERVYSLLYPEACND